ncbi:MAG TPA: hypothetical protein VIJ55_11710 [Acetobacteraceae bacterium]
MSLTQKHAERSLRERLGEPINRVTRGKQAGQDNSKLLGFSADGRLLALNRKATKTHLWIEPPDPPELDGVLLKKGDAPRNADLTGRFSVLLPPNGRGIEVVSDEGLKNLLDWYVGSSTNNAVEPIGTELHQEVAFARTRSDAAAGPLERAIAEMCDTVERTVANSNAQIVERVIKNKELRMTRDELEKLVASLLEAAGCRCALSGIPFQLSGSDSDLLPSVDRIDSNGHYESGNIQVVCRFLNRWKSDGDNEEFRRLLTLVRDGESSNMTETSLRECASPGGAKVDR